MLKIDKVMKDIDLLCDSIGVTLWQNILFSYFESASLSAIRRKWRTVPGSSTMFLITGSVVAGERSKTWLVIDIQYLVETSSCM